MLKYIDIIVAFIMALIFTTWHAILTSLVIANFDDVKVKFLYVFGVEWVAFIPLGIAFILITWMGRAKPELFTELNTRVFLAHFSLAVIIFVVHAIWQPYVNSIFLNTKFSYASIERDFMSFLEMRYPAYIIMVGLVGGIIKLKEYHKLTVKESGLALELQKAKLRELEFKMNPEIIYPNIKYIRNTAKISPEKASQMVIHMAGLLRKLVDNLNGDLVKISDDAYLFSLYIDMLKLRKEKAIHFQLDIEKSVSEKRITPTILLAPFIEELVFGSYESHFKELDKIKYRAKRKADGTLSLEISIFTLSEIKTLIQKLEEETFFKNLSQSLKNFTAGDMNIYSKVNSDEKSLVLCVEVRQKMG